MNKDLAGADDKIKVANFLCPGNYVVSGGMKGIEAAEKRAKEFKAKMVVRLAVAGERQRHAACRGRTRRGTRALGDLRSLPCPQVLSTPSSWPPRRTS